MAKGGVIQIPNSVVRNRNINSIEFMILVRFKYLHFLNGNNDEINIDLQKLKSNIRIDDNRTIKKYINNLHKEGYICDEVEIKRRNPVIIKLNIEKLQENPYTQLPVDILEKLDTIDYIGLRLLYYYESYINRKNIKNQFCFAAMDTIEKHTGISKKTIIKYNEILVKHKLVKIEKHKLETEYNYNDHDELVYDKYNNHYYVRIDNM